MEILIRINGQTAGRDKIARIVQYASKLLWYELQSINANDYLIEKLQILESTCSSFRKMLRFGRCLDTIYSILSTFHQPDIILKITLTLSRIANSLFLFADHIVWLSRSGFLRNVDANKWNHISNKYWLLNITINIIRDLYEILKVLHQEYSIVHSKHISQEISFNLHFLHSYINTFKCRQDIVIDTIKNFCDVWIPLSNLQQIKLKPGTIGLLGTISSMAALYTIIKPVTKLSFT